MEHDEISEVANFETTKWEILSVEKFRIKIHWGLKGQPIYSVVITDISTA